MLMFFELGIREIFVIVMIVVGIIVLRRIARK